MHRDSPARRAGFQRSPRVGNDVEVRDAIFGAHVRLSQPGKFFNPCSGIQAKDGEPVARGQRSLDEVARSLPCADDLSWWWRRGEDGRAEVLVSEEHSQLIQGERPAL